jgi:hypothetical protein
MQFVHCIGQQMEWQQGLTQHMCPHAAQPPKLTPTPLSVLAGQGESPPLLSAIEMSHFTFFQKEVRARQMHCQGPASEKECGQRNTPTGGVGRWRLGVWRVMVMPIATRECEGSVCYFAEVMAFERANQLALA